PGGAKRACSRPSTNRVQGDWLSADGVTLHDETRSVARNVEQRVMHAELVEELSSPDIEDRRVLMHGNGLTESLEAEVGIEVTRAGRMRSMPVDQPLQHLTLVPRSSAERGSFARETRGVSCQLAQRHPANVSPLGELRYVLRHAVVQPHPSRVDLESERGGGKQLGQR